MNFNMTTHQYNQPSDEPLYNIGVVSRMTGIPVATLRVWERRYAFPESSRTSGGHRLYSEREILRLRWVKSRIDEGMQTGRAIHALAHLEHEGNGLPDGPLASSGAAPRTTVSPVRVPSTQLDTNSLTAVTDRLTRALLEHNLQQADQIIGETLAVHPLEHLLMEVIPKALVSIGQAWHDGEISIATEHLATNYMRNRLLIWMSTGPPTYDVPPIVLTCAPDEWHEMTLLIFGVLLRRQRWPVAYLGQSLPLPDLADFINETRPDAVVMVAMTDEGAAKLSDWPTALPAVIQSGTPIMTYAGAVFANNPEWQEKIQGLYLGDSVEQGINTLDSVLRERYNMSG